MTTELEARPENRTARYDLSESEMLSRANKLLERKPVESGFVCYVSDDARDEYREFTDMARTEEARAFTKFNNTPVDMERLYGAYDDARTSLFSDALYVEDDGAHSAGALRMVRNSERGLPTTNEMAAKKNILPTMYEEFLYSHYGIDDPMKCWDIATAAVPPEYRGTKASALLYRAGLMAAKAAGIEHFFAIIDKEAFGSMEILGFPFQALPDESWQPFEGSTASLPVYARVADFEPAIQARQDEYVRAGKKGIATRFPFDIIGRGANDDLIVLS